MFFVMMVVMPIVFEPLGVRFCGCLTRVILERAAALEHVCMSRRRAERQSQCEN